MTYLDIVAEQSRQVQDALEARERSRRMEWDYAVREIVSDLCDKLTGPVATRGWVTARHAWTPGGISGNCVRCPYPQEHPVHTPT